MHKSLTQWMAALCLVSFAGCFPGGDCVPIVQADPVTVTDNGAWAQVAGGPRLDGLQGYQSPAPSVQLVDDGTGYFLGGASRVQEWESYNGNFNSSLHKTTDGGQTWGFVQGALTSVHFVDPLTGWAVGGEGLILKTGDGGATWTPQNTGTTTPLAAVHFTSSAVGHAVGEGGLLLRTANGGGSWSVQKTGTKEPLLSVYFPDGNTGYAVGYNGMILKTSNAGATWARQNSGYARFFGNDFYFNSVHFTDAENGWIVGSDLDTVVTRKLLTYTTANGGKTWVRKASVVLDASLARDYLSVKAVQATGPATAWAVIEAKGSSSHYTRALLKTTDGGATWAVNKQIDGVASAVKIEGSAASGASSRPVYFADATNGWLIVGDSVLATHDGGQTWAAPAGGTGQALASVHFANAGTGFAVGLGGAILKTTNGGAAWTLQQGGFPKEAVGFYFLNAQTGWVVGKAGAIAKTIDGGKKWSAQAGGTSDDLRAVHFADAQNGLIVGNLGNILKTTDGGAHWTPAAPAWANTPSTNVDLLGVHLADAQTGYAVGYKGLILKTTNGGGTWTGQPSGTESHLAAVRFVNASTGWAAGGSSYGEGPSRYRGVILKTTDGGASWVVQDSLQPLKLNALAFVDATTGYAAGGGGHFAEWEDMGPYSSGCKDPQGGMFAHILKTTDGGAHWVAERTRKGDPLLSVSCAASGACLATGWEGFWRRP
jgi:photosystem II stability/assembly factor-like uncharacterized protein